MSRLPLRLNPTLDRPTALTPIETYGGIKVKRDDLFSVAGVQGGKVRSCYALALDGKKRGASGLVTAGSRHSPQVEIVAHLARYLGMHCIAYVPRGETTPEIQSAERCGALVLRTNAGYNNVLSAAARRYAAEFPEYEEIPFGMECDEAVYQTACQAAHSSYDGVWRVVVPVGSGMSLAGVLWGLLSIQPKNEPPLPVLGVIVGADPTGRLDRYAPANWRDFVTLIKSPVPYGTHIHERLNRPSGALDLDPVYEAKCVEFLQDHDLLWVIGRRVHVGS